MQKLAMYLVIPMILMGCLAGGGGSTPPQELTVTERTTRAATPVASATPTQEKEAVADVIAVEVTGEPGAYRFAVEVRSPDLGCEQYADWWEVLREDGTLVYRRILAHSHVEEQPFVRTGGPIDITPETVVVVRAHMHPDGYGGVVFKGTVSEGFTEATISADFAKEVEQSPPQPDGCAF